MILQDLNTATDVKLAVIAEVTQGSKPVLGAKVCHHNTIIIAIKIKCFIIIVISTIIVFVTVMLRKVVAEVERPQGAPILLTLKVKVHSDNVFRQSHCFLLFLTPSFIHNRCKFFHN